MSVMKEFVREELDGTEFVAILLDETSDLANKPQLSTQPCYMDDLGHIEKKFLGITIIVPVKRQKHFSNSQIKLFVITKSQTIL